MNTDQVVSNTNIPTTSHQLSFCAVSLKSSDSTGNTPTLSITNVPNPQNKTLQDYQRDDERNFGSPQKPLKGVRWDNFKINGTIFPFAIVENRGIYGYISNGQNIFVIT